MGLCKSCFASWVIGGAQPNIHKNKKTVIERLTMCSCSWIFSSRQPCPELCRRDGIPCHPKPETRHTETRNLALPRVAIVSGFSDTGSSILGTLRLYCFILISSPLGPSCN